MPVPKIPLAEALGQLQSLGRARIVVANGPAVAQLEGPLSFEQQGEQVVLKVGCACTVRLAKDRVRHVVLSEKESEGKPAGHAQLFDGNYDKLVAFAFPEGLEPLRKMVAKLDGYDFEIA